MWDDHGSGKDGHNAGCEIHLEKLIPHISYSMRYLQKLKEICTSFFVAVIMHNHFFEIREDIKKNISK